MIKTRFLCLQKFFFKKEIFEVQTYLQPGAVNKSRIWKEVLFRDDDFWHETLRERVSNKLVISSTLCSFNCHSSTSDIRSCGCCFWWSVFVKTVNPDTEAAVFTGRVWHVFYINDQRIHCFLSHGHCTIGLHNILQKTDRTVLQRPYWSSMQTSCISLQQQQQQKYIYSISMCVYMYLHYRVFFQVWNITVFVFSLLS